MAIDSDSIRHALVQFGAIEGVLMSPAALLEDVVQLANTWPQQADFERAVASTIQAMTLACAGRVDAAPLQDKLSEWKSYHYQLRRKQGEAAVLRLVFRPIEGGIEVRGFGHRFRPMDFYQRTSIRP